MIKALLFDLDDTLYDEKQFVKGGFEAVSLYISERYNVSKNAFYQTLLKTLEKEGRGHTFDIALKRFGLYKKGLVTKLVQIYRNHKPRLFLYPDAHAVLSKLKNNYKLGLITDGNQRVQRKKVQVLKIKDFFNVIIFTNHYGIEKQKPSPFPYQKAIEKLGVKPTETIYVGDNSYKDFIGAKKVGIYTIRVLRGEYKDVRLDKAFEADYEVRNLREIIDFLSKD